MDGTKKVFVSYGHDHFQSVVEQFVDSLKNEGYTVFMDSKNPSDDGKGVVYGIRPAYDYNDEIDDAICGCDAFIFFMTKHSVRREGYCLNEITRAQEKNKLLIPIMLEQVTVPLNICRIQYIGFPVSYNDATQQAVYSEETFSEVFSKVVSCIEKKSVLSDRALVELESPSTLYMLQELCNDFVGREWMMEQISNWVTNYTPAHYSCISGSMGSGKSAFSANFAMRYSEIIKAVHFCHADDYLSCDPRVFMRMIANMMSIQMQTYREEISRIPELGEIKQYSISRTFLTLFVEPLRNIEQTSDSEIAPFAVLIDGLDELLRARGQSGYSSINDLREFINCLNKYENQLPSWFKVVMTSRPDGEIRGMISGMDLFDLDDREASRKDCRLYIESMLPSFGINTDSSVVEAILERSESNFRYLSMLFSGFRRRSICENTEIQELLSSIPNGLTSLYYTTFSELFYDDYQSIAPFFALLCAAVKNLRTTTVAKLLGVNPRDIAEFKNRARGFVREIAGRVMFNHSSVREWLMSDESREFEITAKEGEDILVNALKGCIDDRNFPNSGYLANYGFYHLIINEEYDLIVRAFENSVSAYEKFGHTMAEMDVDIQNRVWDNLASRLERGTANKVVVAYAKACADTYFAQNAIDLLSRSAVNKIVGPASIEYARSILCNDDRYNALVCAQKALNYADGSDASDYDSLYEFIVCSVGYGDVLKNTDKCEEAINAYNGAEQASDKALDLCKDNDYRLREIKHLRCELFIKRSNVEKEIDNFSDARLYAQKQYELALDIRTSYPSENTDMLYSESLIIIGDTMMDNKTDDRPAKERLTEAFRVFNEAFEIREKMFEEHPNSVNRDSLTYCYDRLGDVARRLGHNDEARKQYTLLLANSEELAKEFPSKQNRRSVSVALTNLALIARSDNNIAEAERYDTAALEIDEALAKEYPGFETKRDYAFTLNALCADALAINDWNKATYYSTEAYNLLTEINNEYKRLTALKDLLEAKTQRGRVELRKGNHEKAIKYFNEATEIKLKLMQEYKVKDSLLGIEFILGLANAARNDESKVENAVAGTVISHIVIHNLCKDMWMKINTIPDPDLTVHLLNNIEVFWAASAKDTMAELYLVLALTSIGIKYYHKKDYRNAAGFFIEALNFSDNEHIENAVNNYTYMLRRNEVPEDMMNIGAVEDILAPWVEKNCAFPVVNLSLYKAINQQKWAEAEGCFSKLLALSTDIPVEDNSDSSSGERALSEREKKMNSIVGWWKDTVYQGDNDPEGALVLLWLRRFGLYDGFRGEDIPNVYLEVNNHYDGKVPTWLKEKLSDDKIKEYERWYAPKDDSSFIDVSPSAALPETSGDIIRAFSSEAVAASANFENSSIGTDISPVDRSEKIAPIRKSRRGRGLWVCIGLLAGLIAIGAVVQFSGIFDILGWIRDLI